MYATASLYDTLNINSLHYNIPEHLRLDSNAADLITFTNMLGQHYDIIYTYIHKFVIHIDVLHTHFDVYIMYYIHIYIYNKYCYNMRTQTDATYKQIQTQ